MMPKSFNLENKSHCNAYYVVGEKGEWGPIPWSSLRLWLAMGLLDRDVELREDDGAGRRFKARAIERLWKIAGRDFTPPPSSERKLDMGGSPAAEALPCSQSMRRRLVETLRWPGRTDILNYRDADLIRRKLEWLFPDPNRPLFDDPDWPASWSSMGSRAQVAKRQAEMAQEQITEKKAAWESAKAAVGSSVPATAPQMFRLEFAASRLGKTLRSQLTEKAASVLINEWFNANPDLEDEYQEMKEEDLAVEMEFENLFDNLDDWQKFRHLFPVPDNMVPEAFMELGVMYPAESRSDYYDHILNHIPAAGPHLLTGAHPPKPPGRNEPPRLRESPYLPESPFRVRLKTVVVAFAFVAFVAAFLFL